nr:hypothetical protein Iba_chr12aCG15300 [Ipomoea batatas]
MTAKNPPEDHKTREMRRVPCEFARCHLIRSSGPSIYLRNKAVNIDQFKITPMHSAFECTSGEAGENMKSGENLHKRKIDDIDRTAIGSCERRNTRVSETGILVWVLPAAPHPSVAQCFASSV